MQMYLVNKKLLLWSQQIKEKFAYWISSKIVEKNKNILLTLTNI